MFVRKRVLVSGGAGFLGSHLCERLLADRHEVLCVDNFFTGNKENIAHLVGNPLFELMRHDVTFPLYVEVEQIVTAELGARISKRDGESWSSFYFDNFFSAFNEHDQSDLLRDEVSREFAAGSSFWKKSRKMMSVMKIP